MVAIASGKGGVGKSTIAANLGIALGQMKRKVCLFDADTNLANINILFGVNPEYTLENYLAGDRPLEQILLTVSEQLQIVPAASGIAEFIELSPDQQQQLMKALRTIEDDSDLILVDSAAGIGNSQLNFFLAAACPILIITPEPTSLTDAFSFLKMARRFGFERPVYVIINQASDLHAARSAFKRFKAATEKYLQLEVGYLGYVLQDHQVPDSVSQQKPVMLNKPDSLASRCIRVIAERLLRLLANESGCTGSLSDYLSEMNQPFGIEIGPTVSGESRSGTSGEAQWLQQVLSRLGEMDIEQGQEMLRQLNNEWSRRHGRAGSDLLPVNPSPVALHPGSSSDASNPVVSAETEAAPSPAADDPGGRQSGRDGCPDYQVAMVFADKLARIESG
ncbi:MAG: MinD/ParA family protein [Sedimenticola sp.]|nr:MinD/ParA family protein [Sedimenticola sp.]